MINEIRKFFRWCNDNLTTLRIRFSSPVVSLYLLNLDRELRAPASVNDVGPCCSKMAAFFGA